MRAEGVSTTSSEAVHQPLCPDITRRRWIEFDRMGTQTPHPAPGSVWPDHRYTDVIVSLRPTRSDQLLRPSVAVPARDRIRAVAVQAKRLYMAASR